MHERCASDPVQSRILFSEEGELVKTMSFFRFAPEGRKVHDFERKHIQTQIPMQGKENHKDKRITKFSK